MARVGCAVLLAAILFMAWGATARELQQSEVDYKQLIKMSMMFYEAQQSGNLAPWNRISAANGGWRRSAHLDDGKTIGKDLVGGYYDAGDYLKAPHALSWTLANLAFSAIEFPESYKAAGEWDAVIRNIKWGLDWLVKAHLKASDDADENVFVGQLGGRPDHWFFGRPEHSQVKRNVYVADKDSPGADLAGEYAAAYAAGANLFRGLGQKEYADMLFKHAKQAFAFGNANKQNWKTPAGVFQAYPTYWPEGHKAQLLWGAVWMCKYDKNFCEDAIAAWNDCMLVNNIKYALGYDWDTVLPGAAAVAVSANIEEIAAPAKTLLEGYMLSKWQDTSSKCPKPSYSTVCYTRKGLAYYADWGTLRASANAAFIGTLMAKYGDNKDANMCFARNQLRYITGASTGRSYVIGYGPKQPQRPHHRSAACSAKYTAPCKLGPITAAPTVAGGNGTCCAGEGGKVPCCDAKNFVSDRPSPIKLVGALVGGPDQTDTYPDVRNDYQRSEVSIDYNGGYTGALAGLAAVTDGRDNLDSTCKRVERLSNSCKKVKDFTQCGGMGDTCPAELAGKCIDGPWPTYCCPRGQTCQKRNQWFWICTAAVPPPY